MRGEARESLRRCTALANVRGVGEALKEAVEVQEILENGKSMKIPRGFVGLLKISLWFDALVCLPNIDPRRSALVFLVLVFFHGFGSALIENNIQERFLCGFSTYLLQIKDFLVTIGMVIIGGLVTFLFSRAVCTYHHKGHTLLLHLRVHCKPAVTRPFFLSV